MKRGKIKALHIGFILWGLIFGSQSSVAKEEPLKLEAEIEARISLTKRGFRKLVPYFKDSIDRPVYKSVHQRNDLYFEVFDGKDFLLEKSEPILKLRLKNKSQKVEMQLSKKMNSGIGLCGVHSMMWSLQKRIAQPMSKKRVNSYFNVSRRLFVKLDGQDSDSIDRNGILTFIRFLDRKVRKVLSKGLEDYLSEYMSPSYVFVPTHRGTKYYLKKKIHNQTLPSGLKASLRKVAQHSGQDILWNYELEVEPVNSQGWTGKKLMEFTCKYFKLHRLNPSDTTIESSTRKLKTLEGLRKLNP